MRDEEGDSRRKKGKRGNNVPLSELGFKARLYSGIETEYTRRRVKYKAARYGVENSKECFMARLTLTLQVEALSPEDIQTLPSFRGIKKAEWEKVRAVTYHSRDELVCAICLDKDFRAPQMTHCGHVFCWPCIYMHHFRSLKATNCPVCNEIYSLEALVTCLPLHGRAFPEFDQNHIRLALKCHPPSNGRVYNSLDYKEDMRFSRVVKASTPKIITIFEQERGQLEDFLKECDGQIKEWVAKVISLAYDKIERTTYADKYQYRLHRGEWRSDGYILGSLEDRQSTVTFYQQHSGRLIFLHPLCDKFLRTGPQLTNELYGEIIQWQQVQYNLQMARRYKQLHHLVLNQEIDLVILDMRPLLPPTQYAQFEEELALCHTRKQQQRQREQREAGRLQVKYEQEKEYLQKLKKMEESEFYDIRVPTTINPNQLNDNAYFPSLIQTKSQPHPSPPQPPITTQKQQKPPTPILNEGDFPGLVLQPKIEIISNEPVDEAPQLQVSKSEQPKITTVKVESDFPHMGWAFQGEQGVKLQKKGSRRKKEKFVNVTEQFFQRREEDD